MQHFIQYTFAENKSYKGFVFMNFQILREDAQWRKNASLLQEIVKKKRTMIFTASKFRKSRKNPASSYEFQEFHVSNDFCSLQVQSITKKENFGAEPNSDMMDSDLNKI
ncbi:hypothetical protein Fot_20627 [Forsythia ovata]|uniref:Uncharacterized protein n=1 Tax=Forsythia ovata TaxID=205694 RepID=A0ABD1USI5_9LAMI